MDLFSFTNEVNLLAGRLKRTKEHEALYRAERDSLDFFFRAQTRNYANCMV